MRTSRKHDVITVRNTEYVTTEMTQILLFVIYYFRYFCDINGPTLLKYPPEYTAYFFEPPCILHSIYSIYHAVNTSHRSNNYK